ncbi:hypothetical protein BaRGS_00038628, partial [Batillaria attramentaria]
ARLAAVIWLFFLISPCVQGIKTSCELRREGKSGELICQFSENIGRTKHDFVVQRYDLNTSETPEEVVFCTWITTGLNCITQEGYSMDEAVTSIVFVKMPHLMERMSGRYVCQVVGSDDDDEELCTFIYEADVAQAHFSSEPPEEDVTTPSPPPSIVAHGDKKRVADLTDENVRTWVIVLTVLVAAVVIWAAIITETILWTKGRKSLPLYRRLKECLTKVTRKGMEEPTGKDVEMFFTTGEKSEESTSLLGG